jgi:lipopolysaccharide transport system permease protein
MKNEKTTIYSAEASNRSLLHHLRGMLRELPQAHELGMRLFKRNLKAMYRQSVLGFAWALIPPLVTAALWIFLRSNGVMSMGDTGISYAVFVLTGTLLWQIFSESINAPINSINSNKAMLSKINIPREGLLLAGIYELAFNMAIKIGMIVLMLLFFQQQVSVAGLLMVPVGILAIVITGYAIGLALVPVAMLFTDIQRGIAVILPFLMYLTPIIYPTPKTGMFGAFMKLNPLATIIPQTRNWLTAQPAVDMPLFWIYTAVFLLILLVSLIVFRLAMPMIIERIGS